jgi:hypothetical protein
MAGQLDHGAGHGAHSRARHVDVVASLRHRQFSTDVDLTRGDTEREYAIWHSFCRRDAGVASPRIGRSSLRGPDRTPGSVLTDR